MKLSTPQLEHSKINQNSCHNLYLNELAIWLRQSDEQINKPIPQSYTTQEKMKYFYSNKNNELEDNKYFNGENENTSSNNVNQLVKQVSSILITKFFFILCHFSLLT